MTQFLLEIVPATILPPFLIFQFSRLDAAVAEDFPSAADC